MSDDVVRIANCALLQKNFTSIIKLRGDFEQEFFEFERTKNAEKVITTQKSLEKKIKLLFEFFSNIPKDWQDFYKTEFNIDLSRTKIKIPEKREGFDRLIVIARGITASKIYDACSKKFKCKREIETLDITEDYSERSSQNDTYAIWVKDNMEADYEWESLSADEIKEKNIKTETLTERLMHELKHWEETKEHLDQNSITLCSGSRLYEVNVPTIEFNIDSVLHIDYRLSKGFNDDVRPREVVE